MKDIPVEIERKYVILKPDICALRRLGDIETSEIEQTYLSSRDGETRRVRKRTYADRTVYTETVKRRIDRISCFEDEREISASEYETLLLEMAEGTVTLKKTRHALLFLGVCFEIDVYPEWQYTCILETELASRDEHPVFPPEIKVVCEVTGDKKYSNAAMSRTFPKELV